jgi:hypothetical protein
MSSHSIILISVICGVAFVGLCFALAGYATKHSGLTKPGEKATFKDSFYTKTLAQVFGGAALAFTFAWTVKPNNGQGQQDTNPIHDKFCKSAIRGCCETYGRQNGRSARSRELFIRKSGRCLSRIFLCSSKYAAGFYIAPSTAEPRQCSWKKSGVGRSRRASCSLRFGENADSPRRNLSTSRLLPSRRRFFRIVGFQERRISRSNTLCSKFHLGGYEFCQV